MFSARDLITAYSSDPSIPLASEDLSALKSISQKSILTDIGFYGYCLGSISYMAYRHQATKGYFTTFFPEKVFARAANYGYCGLGLLLAYGVKVWAQTKQFHETLDVLKKYDKDLVILKYAAHIDNLQ